MMKFKTNRFAIFPHQCVDCKQYIWMESYRKASVWKMDRFIVKTLCEDCLENYLSIYECAKENEND